MKSRTIVYKRAIVWFRSDLRIMDNQALYNACLECDEVIAVYINVPKQLDEHHIGDNKRWFIAENIRSLKGSLDSLNIPLISCNGTDYSSCAQYLTNLAKHLSITHLYFNRELEFNESQRDKKVTKALSNVGVRISAYNDQTLTIPGQILTKSGDFFRVFTPFKRAFLKAMKPENCVTLPSPAKRTVLEKNLIKEAFKLSENIKCPEKTCDYIWAAGENSAQIALDDFTLSSIDNYHNHRDLPGYERSTSRLSPHLSIGAISVRQCFVRASNTKFKSSKSEEGANCWINELIWREFYKHIVVGFPNVCKGYVFNRNYQTIPWRKASRDFTAWCEGKTGYPLVDAGMKQLIVEGWMHNRLRMVTAMFLTKHLLIDWRHGELFFLEHLIDADYSANNGGWQWSASTGADAAPYFRIFSPARQSERFDKDGTYIKQYLPELSKLTVKSIHAPTAIEAQCSNYPTPIVEHKFATDRAKTTYKTALEHYSLHRNSAMEHAL